MLIMLAWWEGGSGIPTIPTMVPWWPYYPGVYSPACRPGYTSWSSCPWPDLSTAGLSVPLPR